MKHPRPQQADEQADAARCRLRGFALAAILTGKLACSNAPPATAPSPGAPPAQATAPQLVVAVVFDQLGSSTLLKHFELLSPEGAIRSIARRGVFIERGVYPYATTLTAPGHATIFTGTIPARSGIAANDTWDRETARPVATVRDARYRVFGREEAVTVGPGQLQTETVAGALLRQTSGTGHAVALSLKDRAAIFSGGPRVNCALWYDHTLPGFTSSNYWTTELPDWVEAFAAAHPLERLLTAWQPLQADVYERVLGRDNAPGELNGGGLRNHFPHDPRTTPEPFGSLRMMPALSEYLIALAEQSVTEYGLGEDDVPDLLIVSISGTDYAGHAFGPDSWEYVDHLVRADLSLGRMLSRLEESRRLSMLITSDHGVAPLPEAVRGHASGRVSAREVELTAKTALKAGSWGDSPTTGEPVKVLGPFVYLADSVRFGPDRKTHLTEIGAALQALPGIARALRLDQISASSDEPLLRALHASIAPDNTPDLILVPSPYYILDASAPTGTHHGSVYAYDREVPLLVYDSRLAPQRRTEPVSMLQVAPTLAQMLSISAPSQASAPGLMSAQDSSVVREREQ